MVTRKTIHLGYYAVLSLILISACRLQPYTPKPIEPTANLAKFAQKNPSDAQFQQYLLANGYTATQLPLKQWNLDALTLCALFYHPSLDVARAQWRAALSAEQAAGVKTPPTLNGHIAHSDDDTKKPFALGLSIDVPIETANKRDIRIENAKHLSQAAKLEIAQTAWQLRNNLAQTLAELAYNSQQTKLLTNEQALRQEVFNIMQKRVDLGEASNVERSTAHLQLQTIQTALHSLQENQRVLQARLAGNLGLPLEKANALPLQANDDSKRTANIPNTDLRTAALLNRLDIRIALERYAAAEAKVKLEIAKQHPDIVISPGFAFEFGDQIWSLGLSSLLQFLNKNKLGIAEATQLREVEAAQFEALQAQVILDANVAHAEVMQAMVTQQNQQKLLSRQKENTQRMVRKFSAGEIDRLEFTFAKLEEIGAEKNVMLADYQRTKSLNQLENTLQIPLAGLGVSASVMETTK